MMLRPPSSESLGPFQTGRSDSQTPVSRASSRFSTLFDDALAEVDTPTAASRPTSSALLHSRASSAASVGGLPPVLRSRVGTPADDYDRLVAATNGVPYAPAQEQPRSGGGGRRAGAASTPAPRHGDLPTGASPFARTAARAPPKTKVSVPLRVGVSSAAPASGESPGVAPLAYALPTINTASQPGAQPAGVTPLAAAAAKAAEQHGAWSNWMETRLRDGARHSCAPILASPSSPGGRLATLGVHASEMIDAALAGAAQEQRNAVDAMARMVQAATSGGRLGGTGPGAMPSAWASFATSLLSPGTGASAPGLAGLGQVVAQARQAAAVAVAASLSVGSPDTTGALAEQRQQLAEMERQLADAEVKLHVLNSKMSGQEPRSGEDGGAGQRPVSSAATLSAATPMPPGGPDDEAAAAGVYEGGSMQPGGEMYGEEDASMRAAEHMWGDDGGQDDQAGGYDDVHAAVSEANREAAAAVQAALALHAPTPMPSTAPNSRASTAFGYGFRPATPAGARGPSAPHTPQPPPHLELTPEARRARMTQLLARKQQLQAASVAAVAAKSNAEYSTTGAWAQAAREDTNPEDVLRVARAEAALAMRGSAAKLVTPQQPGMQASMEATLAAASAVQGARVRALLAAPLPSLRVPSPAAPSPAPQRGVGGGEAAGQAPNGLSRGQVLPGRRGGRAQFASANVVLQPRHRSRSPTRGVLESDGAGATPTSSAPASSLGVSAAAGAPQARRTVYSGTPQARKLVRFVPSTAPLGSTAASQPQSQQVPPGVDDFYYDPEAPMSHAQRARAEAEEEAVRLAAQVHADVMAISELTAHMMASLSGVMSPPQSAGVDQERRPATEEERMRMVEQVALDELEAASFPGAGANGTLPAQPPPVDDDDLLARVTAARGSMSVLDVSGAASLTPAGLLAAAAANPALTCVHAGAISGPFSLDQLEALWASLWAPQLIEADLSVPVPELSRLLALLSRRGLRLASLTLTGGTLRGDAVRNLTAAVTSNGGVAALCLPRCFIATDALAELLTSLPPCVSSLDLRGNALAAGGAALLSRFLAAGPEGEGGSPSMVRSLVLDDNAFTDADVALLAVGVARATWLDSLSLRDCKLGPVAAGHLGRALGGPKVSLQSLDVSHNPLGDDGVAALASCLRLGAGAAAGLHTLRLAHVAATGRGIRSLVACLRGNSSLAVLDVSHNALADGGARLLATLAGYPGGALGLSSLDASACSIGPVGALELCHAVADGWAEGCLLRTVTLAGNKIAPELLGDVDLPAGLRIAL